MTKERDCKGSVRFQTEKPAAGQPPPPMSDAYVNRILPEINSAKKIRVTIEVIE
jgi:hypothetical protein